MDVKWEALDIFRCPRRKIIFLQTENMFSINMAYGSAIVIAILCKKKKLEIVILVA